MIRFILLTASIILGIVSGPVWAKVTATVSQNPVYAGQPFTLEITANASLARDDFDRSKLQQPGFVVGQTSTGRRLSNINGKTTRQTQWVTTLLIRKPGTYTIPGFNIDGNMTQPIKLRVIADNGQPTSQQYVKLQTTIDRHAAWQGQPLLYTAKILVGTSLDDANFDPPTAENAQLKQIGKDEQDVEVINGQRYRTLTRRWQITPKEPGELTIKSPVLTGEAGTPNSMFGMTSRPIKATGDDITLRVQKPPKGFSLPWLAASKVTLNDSITPQASEYKPGEAITRTITLTAEEAGLEQLPTLKFNYPKGIRSYPEQPKDHLFVKDGKTYAQRTYTIAIIPEHPGHFKIAKQEVEWWDINELTHRHTTVPEIEFTVAGATTSAPQQPTRPQSMPSAGSPPHSSFPLLGWLGYTLWLLTVILWLLREWRRKRIASPVAVGPSHNSPTGNEWKLVEVACQNADPAKAEHALRDYQHAHREQASILAPFIEELGALVWSAQSSGQWDHHEFLGRLKQALAAQTKSTDSKNRNELPKLNP